MTDLAHATDDAGGHAHHWEVSWAPMAVAFGVFFLVPMTFASALVYHIPLLATVFAAIGVVLTLAGVSRWIFEGATTVGVIQNVSPAGIGFFIFGEILIFFGLFVSYWALRLSAGDAWPPAGTPEINHVLPLIMTVFLVGSSLTYHHAEAKLEGDDRSGFLTWLVITLVLGLAFLSCTGYEYHHLFGEGFTPGTNQYSSAFFTLTGFHGTHVLVGLLAFAAIGLTFLFREPNRNVVKVAGIYWHFVDVVWFFVASQVYYW